MEIIQIRQSGRRSYTISLNKEGKIVLTTPALFSSSQVNEVLYRHRRWITKRVAFFEQNKKNQLEKPDLKDGFIFSLLGEQYTLKLKKHDKRKNKVVLEGDSIVLYADVKSDIGFDDIKKELLIFFKKFAKRVFYDKVDFYASEYGYEYKNIVLKDQKSKWGSCSSKRNLNFNWRLIFAPEEVLTYVVIHEICHLKEMNHSQRFWDLVQQKDPSWKDKRKWLRFNGDRIKNIL